MQIKIWHWKSKLLNDKIYLNIQKKWSLKLFVCSPESVTVVDVCFLSFYLKLQKKADFSHFFYINQESAQMLASREG